MHHEAACMIKMGNKCCWPSLPQAFRPRRAVRSKPEQAGRLVGSRPGSRRSVRLRRPAVHSSPCARTLNAVLPGKPRPCYLAGALCIQQCASGKPVEHVQRKMKGSGNGQRPVEAKHSAQPSAGMGEACRLPFCHD